MFIDGVSVQSNRHLESEVIVRLYPPTTWEVIGRVVEYIKGAGASVVYVTHFKTAGTSIRASTRSAPGGDGIKIDEHKIREIVRSVQGGQGSLRQAGVAGGGAEAAGRDAGGVPEDTPGRR